MPSALPVQSSHPRNLTPHHRASSQTRAAPPSLPLRSPGLAIDSRAPPQPPLPRDNLPPAPRSREGPGRLPALLCCYKNHVKGHFVSPSAAFTRGRGEKWRRAPQASFPAWIPQNLCCPSQPSGEATGVQSPYALPKGCPHAAARAGGEPSAPKPYEPQPLRLIIPKCWRPVPCPAPLNTSLLPLLASRGQGPGCYSHKACLSEEKPEARGAQVTCSRLTASG